ncbi:D-aminoacyl-tRNA deacylase [Candidatus Aerophobetes bacterium]|nr:D-aminoacyl-tRNA deacylase [Candidatus Aerophobetes bacterium]
MLAVVQRVTLACCTVEGKIVGRIGKGFVVFLAVGKSDTLMDASWMAKKIVNLRVFEDEHDHMNLSLFQIGGEILIVPEFTLYGDCKN